MATRKKGFEREISKFSSRNRPLNCQKDPMTLQSHRGKRDNQIRMPIFASQVRGKSASKTNPESLKEEGPARFLFDLPAEPRPPLLDETLINQVPDKRCFAFRICEGKG
jgi:hypothetical protein